MALATRCPHCNTTFRVAHDQLKLRAGLVRCGSCKEIFNGVEHLLHPKNLPQDTGTFAPSAAQPPATQTNPVSAQDETASLSETQHIPGTTLVKDVDATSSDSGFTRGSHDKPSSQTSHPPGALENPSSSIGIDSHRTLDEADPLQRMTLMDFSRFDDDPEYAHEKPDRAGIPEPNGEPVASGSGAATASAPDELSKAIEDLQNRPWRRSEKSLLNKRSPLRKRQADQSNAADAIDSAYSDEDFAEFAEPEFVKAARRQKRFGRAMRIFLIVGSIVLLTGLAVQTVYAFRDLIVAKWPDTKPAMTQLCTFAGCTLSLPAQIDAVSIESSELQTLPTNQNSFMLTALLRNHRDTSQAWPNIELTLNDANGAAIVRRVFEARDYLSSGGEVEQGFAADSERAVKLSFELSELKASGYRIYLFYP